MTPLLRFENISHRYEADGGRTVRALDSVSFSLTRGSFTCLVGPSGSGKSSLLNMAAGFIRPSEGRILCQGKPVTGPSKERAVVFQEESLFPWMRVMDNLTLALRQSGCGRRDAPREARRLLDLTGLKGFDRAYPSQLSAGMRQKAAIARGLALSGSLLLMDEPFSALDERSRDRLDGELSALWKQKGMTVLFITHSIDEAIRLGSQIILLSARPGKVTGMWSPEEKEKEPDSRAFISLKKEIIRSMELCCPSCRNGEEIE